MQDFEDALRQRGTLSIESLENIIYRFYGALLSSPGKNGGYVVTDLIPPDEARRLPPPRGGYEARLRKRPVVVRVDLLNAQTRDVIAAYLSGLRMRDGEIPENLRRAWDAELRAFERHLYEVLKREYEYGFSTGAPARRMAERIAAVTKREYARFDATARVYYEKAAWYRVAQYFSQTGYDCFVLKVVEADNTCTSCSDRRNAVYTLEELSADLKLIPPLHPNCRCELIPVKRVKWTRSIGTIPFCAYRKMRSRCYSNFLQIRKSATIAICRGMTPRSMTI